MYEQFGQFNILIVFIIWRLPSFQMAVCMISGNMSVCQDFLVNSRIPFYISANAKKRGFGFKMIKQFQGYFGDIRSGSVIKSQIYAPLMPG